MKEFTLTADNFDDCVDTATGEPIPREGNVVLPERVIFQGEEYKLTGIGDTPFRNRTDLTSIVIPDGVTKIGYDAFAGCTGLTDITIPDSVRVIDRGTFAGCTGLTKITIPDSVKEIGVGTFVGRNGLTNGTFAGCTGLTKITIPDSVKKIGGDTFAGCTGLTKITIPDGVKDIGSNFADGCSDALTISFMGTDISKKIFDLVRKQSDGLWGTECLTIAKDAVDILGKDIYSRVLVSKLCNAEHGGKLEQTAAQIKKDFQTIGFYDIKNSVDVKAKEQLTAMFRADKRSRGVVPKIIDALTIASTELHIQPEQIVKSFEEKKFRDAVMAMRSCNKGNKFCDVETALFAMNFDVNTVKNIILENPNKDYASVLLCESYKKNDEHLKDLAKWVACHPDVSQDLIKDVVKYRNSITIDAAGNVDAVRAQISKGRAMLEINEIEKAYPDFKFADCKCNLPKTEVELGDYKAYIMDAQDPRQVMIGYDTDCCQHLDGEGETAMMYGLPIRMLDFL